MDQRREGICETIRNSILEKTLRNDGENTSKCAFVTIHSLEKIWTPRTTERRLDELFCDFHWADESFLGMINSQLLKVLSILVRIRWTEWSQFKRIFVDREGRLDKDLPFIDIDSWVDKPFTNSMAQDFEAQQSTFLPIIIFENEDRHYSPSFRMPFINAPKLISDKGSYCTVFKEVIARHQYQVRGKEPDANVSYVGPPLGLKQKSKYDKP